MSCGMACQQNFVRLAKFCHVNNLKICHYVTSANNYYTDAPFELLFQHVMEPNVLN